MLNKENRHVSMLPIMQIGIAASLSPDEAAIRQHVNELAEARSAARKASAAAEAARMKPLVVIISIALLLLPFIPMFVIHEKRSKALRKIQITSQEEQTKQDFQSWKKHVRANILISNLAAVSISLFMTPHLFYDLPQAESFVDAYIIGIHAPPAMAFMTLVFVGGAFVLALMASDSTTKASELAKQIGLKPGYKWIEKKPKSGLVLPPPSQVEDLSMPQLSKHEKNLIKAVINGSSIQWAAAQAGIELDRARAIYDAFYAEYLRQPETQRSSFVTRHVG